MRINRLPIAVIEIIFASIALVAAVVNSVFWVSNFNVALAPALFLGAGAATLLVMTLFIIFGFIAHHRRKKYVVEPHPYKRASDKLTVTLNVLNMIVYFAGLLGCFVISTFLQMKANEMTQLCYILGIVGVGGPAGLALLYHILQFFIEYHSLSDYLRVEQLQETKKLK